MDDTKFIVLYPGKFKPFHDGYLSVILSYLNYEDFDIDELRVIVSKTPDDGIEADDTLPFIEKVCSALTDKSGVWVHAVNTIGKSPFRDCSYEVREHPENDYTIASNYTSADEYSWIYDQFDNAEDYSDVVEKVEVNNGEDISSEDLKQYILDDDYESFRAAFDTMVNDLQLVTENDVQDYFETLKSCIEIEDDELSENLRINDIINTKNYINEKMYKNRKKNSVFSINVTALKESCQDISFNAIRDYFRKCGALVEGERVNNTHIMTIKNISEQKFINGLDRFGLEVAPSSLNEGELFDDELFDDLDECGTCECDGDDCREELMDECDETSDLDIDEDLDEMDYAHMPKNCAPLRESVSKVDDYFKKAKDLVSKLDLAAKERAALNKRIQGVAKAKDCEQANEEIHAFIETARELGVKSEGIVKALKAGIKNICKDDKKTGLKESLKTRISNTIRKLNEGKVLNERFKTKLAKQEKQSRRVFENAAIETINNAIINNKVNESKNTTLENRIATQINNKRAYLYEKTRVNGINLRDLDLNTIKCAILESAQTVKRIKKENANLLNESAAKTGELKLAKARRLVELLLEEYEYRKLYNSLYLNEKDEEPSADEVANLAAMFSGDDFGAPEDSEKKDKEEKSEEPKDDKPKELSDEDSTEEETDSEDEGEEVELSGIVFTMKNKKAAKEFIQCCVDGGVPEDALEIVEEDAEDEEPEETEEVEVEETDDTESNEANEAFNAFKNRFRRLFEDDEELDVEDETEEVDLEEPETEEGGESDDASDDEDDDTPVKVRLVDTDYTKTVAQVLDDVYSITKEEFEDMIGGVIIDEETEDGEDAGKSDDEDDDTEAETVTNDDIFGGL